VLWLLASSLLLVAGAAVAVLGLYELLLRTDSVKAEDVRSFQVMMAFYFRIVCFQGLLPALLLTLVLWPALARLAPLFRRDRTRLFLGLLLAAAVAYAFVGPLLLSAHWTGLPALAMRNALDQVGTAVLVVAAVAAAAWLPRVLLPPLRTSGP
jgi:hypothetical protein